MKIFDKILIKQDLWRPNRYELRPYLLKDGKTHPFAIVLPGGGYGMIYSYMEGRPIAKMLNEKGYHAFVLYYRVKEKAFYPNPQNDLERAIRKVLSNQKRWKLDLNGWSVWGSSAGAHLTASYFTEKRDTPKPAAIVLSYPVITMGEHTHAGSRDYLTHNDPALVAKLSVQDHVTADYPPAYLWNGTVDMIVDPVNCRMMEQALEKAGVPHLAEQFEGINHGAGLAKGSAAEVWCDHAIKFWEEHR